MNKRNNEGERENNSFWYIKHLIEREINKAYRIRRERHD